jgi:uncharacterized protein YecT (DUF1311 family)
MRLLKTTLFSLFLLSGYCTFSQNIATVNKYDSLYKACLTHGKDLEQCSEKYYTRMDSMLNVVYKALLARYDKKGKATLKSEQADWIINRDTYFDKAAKEDSAMSDAGDKQMDIADKKAGYVRKRVLILLNRLTY